MASFGDRLRKARMAASLTQEELGFRVGVSKQAVSDWERGRVFPSPYALPVLKKELGVTLDYLYCGDGTGRERSVHETGTRYDVTLTPELRRVLDLARRMSPQQLKAFLTLLRRK